jgi:glutathione S-transferase
MARDPFTREEIDAGLDILEDLTRRIEAYLQNSGGPWLFGERLTLADIAVAPYVVRFEEERPARMRPGTQAWWSRFTSRPAWKVAEIGGYEADTARNAREAMTDPG